MEQKIPSLKSDDLILTPNQRLAAKLRNQFATEQVEAGNAAWLTPTILPLQIWSVKLWQNLQASSLAGTILLNPLQEFVLWQTIVRSFAKEYDLLQITQTAKAMRTAWQLCQDWQLDWNHQSFQLKQDCEFFVSCAKQFSSQCEKNGWIDLHAIPQQLTLHLRKEHLNTTRIILAGFDELVPSHHALIHHLQGCNVTIEEYNPTVETHDCYRIALPNSHDEIYHMARWAKKQYEKSPNQQIACIVPELQSLRDAVENIFYQVFQPQNYKELKRADQIPFNISAGKPLHDFALIHIIFKALHIATKDVNINEFGVLLRSPYLGESQQELSQRARCDIHLRDFNLQQIPLAQLLAICNKDAPLFAKRFYAANQYLQAQKENQTAETWITIFSHYLEKLGWPGERTIASEEFQLLSAWKELLTHFISLDYIGDKLSLQEAILLLEEASQQTIFQTKSKSVPIQILGILEAAGQVFDHIFLMGMHDLAWPKPAQPNPFIPFALQRQFNMPNSSALREFQFAKRLTTRFLQSARVNFIVSFPQTIEGQETQISHLMAHLPEDNTSLTDRGSWYQSVSEKLEEIDDDTLIPQTLENLANIKGGTAIIKNQAACPFRAFALFRLNAKTFNYPTPGLSALEKGNLLHKSLEFFWCEIKDQASLCELPQNQLEIFIEQCIDKALQEFFIHESFILNKRYIHLEKKRLQHFIKNYLTIEKERPPFRVLATEERQEFLLSDLKIKLQIDRVDLDEQGNQIIIDYKTNDPTIYSWFDERPNEPQLPLYCIANYQTIHALTFLQINRHHIGYKGIAATDIAIKGIVPIQQFQLMHGSLDWQTLKQQWSLHLTNLANDFIQGYAMVAPKNGNQTCQHCHLHALCRVKL